MELQLYGGVPPAPFAKTWPTLAVKRKIRCAAENGYERVAFPTGPIAAKIEGHQLITDIDTLRWRPDAPGKIEYKRRGARIFSTAEFENEKSHKDYVGADAAKQLIEGTPNAEGVVELATKDTVFGGEKMRWFYDRNLNNVHKRIRQEAGQECTGWGDGT